MLSTTFATALLAFAGFWSTLTMVDACRIVAGHWGAS